MCGKRQMKYGRKLAAMEKHKDYVAHFDELMVRHGDRRPENGIIH